VRTPALLLLVLGGCAGQVKPPAEPLPPPDAATVAAIVEAHNERVALLDRTYSSGVLEYRWVDDRGDRHAEPQVNARLWLDLPRHTALRAEKLGDVLFWLGSDDERYWMFDLVRTPSTLLVGAHEASGARPPGLLVPPLALVDLIGLTPLPAPETLSARTVIRDGEERIVLEGPGAGGPMRLFIVPGRDVPDRVEVLDAEGRPVLEASLVEYASVLLPGRSRIGLPRMPGRIDIVDAEGTMFVKLAIGETTVDAPERQWAVVFDLDRLVESMRPDEIRRP
jgi:hypothetical protein